MSFDKVYAALLEHGLLLLSDAQWPSVTTLIAGEAMKGSWWGHAKGQEIFGICNQLDEHADVMSLKLLAGKVTFVHRSLWPAVLGVATSNAPWQQLALPDDARAVLDIVDAQGRVQLDVAATAVNLEVKYVAALGTQLERRLLVYCDSVHTASGQHVRVLESWAHWRKRIGYKDAALDDAEARQILEERVLSIPRRGKLPTLPWL